MRKQLGKEPSKYPFDGYSSITASYVPAVGDQYWWSWAGGKHTGISIGVTASNGVNGLKSYAVTIDETNVDCKNGEDRFTATFAVRNGSVVTALKHPSLGATSYYYR